MADAIPVNSETKKVNVKPAEKSYIEKSMLASNNLGDKRDFQSESQQVRELQSTIDLPNGKQHVHTYTREDR